MNSILSRTITGIFGLVIGGILNGCTNLLLINSQKTGAIDSLASASFFLLGIILGSCIGIVIGIAQFRVLKSLALGAGVTFLLYILFLSWIGGGDMYYAEGRKGVYFIFSIVLLDGCFVSLFVGLACNGLMKFFFQKNLETDSSLE
jgi:hypothetical protein